MPPAAHTYGDLSIVPAANPDRHGYGNIELAAAAGNQTVKTVAADLTIQSAKNTYVKALLGNVDVSAQADYLLGAVSSTATLSGKSQIDAAAGLEHTGAAASWFRTSAGDIDVASQAGALTASGHTSAMLSSATGDVFIEATAAGKKIDLKAPTLNVDADTLTQQVTGNYALTTTTGNQSFTTGGAFEAQAAANSYLRTSAGDLDVRASAGSLTAVSSGSGWLVSLDNDVTLQANTVGRSVRVTADRFEVGAASGGANIATTGEARLASTAGDAFLSAVAGNASVIARDDVMVSSDSGDTTVAAFDAAKSVKILAKNVSLGTDNTSTTTANGNLTVVGDLFVNGSTTAIDTVNMAVKDNLVQLNSAPGTAGRFPGLLMARHADDHAGVAGDQSAAFVFDESIDRFKLGYTADNATSTSLTMSRHADLQVEKLYCTNLAASNISIPNFATVSFQINGNSTDAVAPEPALDHYGAYELIVRGPDGGSHGSWRVSKSASGSNSFVAIGASTQGELQDELIAVDWPANSPPVFKHAVTRTDGSTAPILYKLKYLGV